ncbi:carboxymuconolactone decarboxylase family protein [Gimesia aquarii]|uniref:Carboxymuconolactone decarboxylase family protein n=1 Tax=Gimesia aquarii TaxID=2527964 RepID=A0A517VUN5_9PLAN|nr:peroxidase-related enzyme [Gimesia aquarii]QDT96714.1 Carboxymuconolactone decarboxylase family protein [Gimesia aquarii]
MPYLTSQNNMKGIADAFLRDPDLYHPLLEYINQVMTRESQVSIPEREMIAAYVSVLNGCDFCVGVHHQTLEAFGIAQSVIDQLGRDTAFEVLEERMTAALYFAEKLTQDPHHIRHDDIQQLLDQGWTEQAVEDITNVVSLFSCVNRLVDAMGFTGDQGYFERIGSMLATQGYQPLIDRLRKQ